MTILMTDRVQEGGSVGFEVTCTDENGAAMIPTAVTWTLLDQSGNVINAREDVSVIPDSSFTIVLSGDDLVLTTRDYVRLLLVKATYNSDLGASLPFREEVRFQIAPLVGVP